MSIKTAIQGTDSDLKLKGEQDLDKIRLVLGLK